MLNSATTEQFPEWYYDVDGKLVEWYDFKYESANSPACLKVNNMCEGSFHMGEPEIEITRVEVIATPDAGWVVRGIIKNNRMPVESFYFQQPVTINNTFNRFDVDCITEDDIPAILSKLAAIAESTTKKKLPPKEVPSVFEEARRLVNGQI